MSNRTYDVIQLRYIERNSKVGRALNVVKMRNSEHDTGIYLCTITSAGLSIGEPLEGIKVAPAALRFIGVTHHRPPHGDSRIGFGFLADSWDGARQPGAALLRSTCLVQSATAPHV